MTEQSGSGAAPAATPGARLAAARDSLGLSIAEVAGQMRISVRQVQAIEADRYSELPGAVFVRGFVRNYARLLKIDPVPLLHALETELGHDVPLRAHEISGTLPVHARHGHIKHWLVALALVVVAVLGAGGYELWRAQLEPRESPKSAAPLSEPAPTAAPTVTAPEPGSVPLVPERAADSGVSTPVEAAAGAGTTGGAAPASVPGDTAASPAKGSSRSARIEIEFAGQSGVEFRDAEGKVVYSGTGEANTSRTIEAALPLDVIVGNASGVRITYNDKPFDVAAHATRNVARFTLE